MLCGDLKGKEIQKKKTRKGDICIANSRHYTAETNTTVNKFKKSDSVRGGGLLGDIRKTLRK